jgi:hypothetical protein
MIPLYSYCTNFLGFKQCSSGPGEIWMYVLGFIVVFGGTILFSLWRDR